jgi:GxxExxY protein
MTVNNNFKHSELTELIIGVFYEVYNELGFGFLESVYRNAMKIALEEKGLAVEAEEAIVVFFRGHNVGDFRADLIVNHCVLLELKTAERIVAAHEAQAINYLRGSSLEVALVLNFGPKPGVRRLVVETARAKTRAQHAGNPE